MVPGSEIPPEFICPISFEIMKEPVMLVQTGAVFDRETIEEWLSRGRRSCPLTGLELHNVELVPNRNLKDAIERWGGRKPHERGHGSLGRADHINEEGEEEDPGCCVWFSLRKSPSRAVGQGDYDMRTTPEVASKITGAVRKRNVEEVENLARQWDVNVLDYSGRTPLHWACVYGDEAMVKCLVKHGAHVNAPAKDSCAPLHFAVQFNHVEVVQCLIAFGATVDAASDRGFTPLHKAAYWGRTEVALVLLRAGASRESKNQDMQMPIDVAYKSPNEAAQEVFQVLRSS